MDVPDEDAALGEAEAIEIALRAVAGKVTLHEGEPVTVDVVEDKYVVTFVHVVPPGQLGPDFDAQVTLDRRTGKVLKILGGS